MSNIPHISIVSPEYRGENMVHELVERIVKAVSSFTEDYEIILVNDASPDNTWAAIVAECAQNQKVKGLNLSRNFGQHYAITAGLSNAKGDWIIVMDCDLQDRPEEILNLYKKAQEGFDTVLAQRVHREHSWFKQMGSKAFYTLLAYLTETKQDASVANFGIYSRDVVHAILAMGDKMRYFPAQVQWVGFRKAYMPIQHDVRAEGKSSYNLSRLFRLALDTIISFSDKPMRLMVRAGLWITVIAFILALVYLIKYLTGGIEVLGFASIIISIWFLAGIVILLLGILGLYMGKMFETVKNRPMFIVGQKCNFD
ncbi:MAG: glycosyltransferase family 2 protein [Paludibacteraceae bacterium]|nr:glycosyltransferase family 2 protein [Paludibacteraceae bacterium]HOU68324.1 glycosyltransferase family 2 protein [Paludibacteraceae bacterium]HQJ90091.1 glycosyltransferase family 2 protein [Paludibacteraceae bacterium]